MRGLTLPSYCLALLLYLLRALSATSMQFHGTVKNKPRSRSSIIYLVISLTSFALLFLFYSLISTNGSSISTSKFLKTDDNFKKLKQRKSLTGREKYLYWGNRIDYPGKHCDSCEGLGHQESSLRCALEEAMFLQRCILTTPVMPSRMCTNLIHNKKGILHHSNETSSEERWAAYLTLFL